MVVGSVEDLEAEMDSVAEVTEGVDLEAVEPVEEDLEAATVVGLVAAGLAAEGLAVEDSAAVVTVREHVMVNNLPHCTLTTREGEQHDFPHTGAQQS